MGIRSGSTCADPVFGEQKKPLWDPFATLEIINPARGSFTCVGHAPSKRRRCQNPIARHNRDAASNILDSIAQASANSKALESKLRELARVSLCLAYHQNQVDTVVAQWQWKIRSMCPHPLEEAQPDSCEMERQEREREALEWLRHWAQQIHEVLKRQQKERQDKERQEKERQEQERQEQERQEKERQEQERQEKERQEKERQEKEQQEREQKAREQETRNERLRRSAQQLREERERKAREEAEKERKEWDQAWENYVKRWNDFKGKVSTSPSPVLLRTSPVAEAKSTTVSPPPRHNHVRRVFDRNLT